MLKKQYIAFVPKIDPPIPIIIIFLNLLYLLRVFFENQIEIFYLIYEKYLFFNFSILVKILFKFEETKNLFFFFFFRKRSLEYYFL